MHARERKKKERFSNWGFLCSSTGADCYQRGLSIAIFSRASSLAKTSRKKRGGETVKKDAFKSNVYQQFAHHRPNPRHLHHDRDWFQTKSAFVEMINVKGVGKGERLAFLEVVGL